MGIKYELSTYRYLNTRFDFNMAFVFHASCTPLIIFVIANVLKIRYNKKQRRLYL